MKILIEKVDGTPMKSRISAVNFLKKKGIPQSALVEEKGVFYYFDDYVTPLPESTVAEETGERTELLWETPVILPNGENTTLHFKKCIDVVAVLRAKHPAGQNRTSSAVEVVIDGSGFIIPLDLAQKIFEV